MRTHYSPAPRVGSLPAHPTFSEWLTVLCGPVDDSVLRWLLSWVHGHPLLRDEPSRIRLWDVLVVEDLPWTDDLLAEAAGGGFRDGPPTIAHAGRLLRHPASGLAVRRALGFAARAEHSSDTDRGRVAVSALLDDRNPLSRVALYLARGLDARSDLLADHALLYHTALDLLALPEFGGGPPRVETFLSLWADDWSQGIGPLVCTVVELVPGPPHPSVRGLELLYRS